MYEWVALMEWGQRVTQDAISSQHQQAVIIAQLRGNHRHALVPCMAMMMAPSCMARPLINRTWTC